MSSLSTNKVTHWKPSDVKSIELDSILHSHVSAGPRIVSPAWNGLKENTSVDQTVEIRPITGVIPNISVEEMMKIEVDNQELDRRTSEVKPLPVEDHIPQKPNRIEGKPKDKLTREQNISRNLMEEEQRLRRLREENEIFWEKLMKKEDELRLQWGVAKDEGYRVGLEEGLQKFELETEKVRITLASSIEHFSNGIKEIKSDYGDAVLKLSMAVIENIIGTHAEKYRESVFSYIKEALSYIEDEEKIVLKLSQGDYEFLKTEHAHFLEEFNNYRGYVVEPSADIETGGCILEYTGGRIDNTLDTRMKQILEKLDGKN
ncbi:MAG: hypothetical protein JXR95_16535 [Deltaproteobacteria bacterium]|nr:hypothetical protein [Deltaproteobacteria bacterium]